MEAVTLEKQIEPIAKELRRDIINHLIDKCSPHYPDFWKRADSIQDIIDSINFAQLWALYRLVKQDSIFMLRTNSDYLGINLGSMFCGIEQDGYMHS